jgi:hypothetical protein
MNFKVSIKTGMGMLKTSTRPFHVSGQLGALFSFAITEWLIINLECTDQIYYEDYKSRGELKNQIFFRIGTGFLFSLF